MDDLRRSLTRTTAVQAAADGDDDGTPGGMNGPPRNGSAVREALVARAQQLFLAGERIEMRALAAEHGIGRSTLYRWVGDRDRLLGEVLWRLTDATIAEGRAVATGNGVERVLGVIEHVLRAIHGFEPLRRFIAAEPEAAIRVLMTPSGGTHARTVSALEDLVIEERVAADGIPPRTLAYATVRVSEAFLYADVLSGTAPDVDQALVVVRTLLRT